MDIQSTVFIVTGGASGLGEGTARMLAENGANVLIADMQTEKGEAVAQSIGGQFIRCDVSQEADAQAAVAAAKAMGPLFGLINCAGIAPAEKTVGKSGAHSLDTFTRTITVNLVGSFNMIRLCAEAMSALARRLRGVRRHGFGAHPASDGRARRSHQYRIRRGLRWPNWASSLQRL